MAQPLTYQQLLAEQYDENAKDRLVFQNTLYDEDEEGDAQFDPHVSEKKRRGNELEEQDSYRQFAGNRNLEENLIKAKEFEDKSKLSVRYNKDVKLNVFNVDSRFRAFAVPGLSTVPQPTSDKNKSTGVLATATSTASHFIFRASKQIKNAISIKMTSMELPNTFSNFLLSKGNTSFLIAEATTNPVYSVITIPDGYYPVSSTLASAVQTALRESPLLFADIFTCVVNATGNIEIQNPKSLPQNITRVQSGVPNTGLVTFTVSGTIPNFPIGATYVTVTSLFGGPQYVASIVDVPILSIDTVAKTFTVASSLSGNLGTSPYSASLGDLSFEVKYNFDFSYSPISQPIFDSLGTLLGFLPRSYLSQRIRDAPITAAYAVDMEPDDYIYLKLNDYSTVIPQTTNDTYYTVFAKIPITVPKGSLIIDNDSTNSTTKIYRFLQPTNIQQLEIQLLDKSGQELIFDGNFSMTLEIEEVVSHSLYEKLREL
jgi:hypothetical protein